MMRKKSASAPAVDRALDVIELLAASDRDLALSEILKRVNIPRQSLIRILNTLCDRGVLDRAEQRGFYRLGMKLLYLGNRLQDKITLRAVAWPFMQELAEKTHKTIELSTLDRDQLILIEHLAHMEPDKRENVLDRIGLPAVTESTITELKKLEKELLIVKKSGFAFEDQELRKGVRRVVAPIYDFSDNLAGCIGVAATLFSLELEDREYLGRMVKEMANRISYGMGKREEV